MPYFDPKSEEDLRTLPEWIKAGPRLADLIRRAETDVVARYTYPLEVSLDTTNVFALNAVEGVFLKGYNSDVTLATGYAADRSQWTGFARDMRHTIARIVAHRWMHDPMYNREASSQVTREKRGRIEVERKTVQSGTWPAEWNDALRPYDVTVPLYVI